MRDNSENEGMQSAAVINDNLVAFGVRLKINIRW